MKKFLLLLIFLLPSLLFAVIGQNGISIAPDGTLLKWEEGAWDFFIMHKSSLERSPENKAAALDADLHEIAGNPQGDTLNRPDDWHDLHAYFKAHSGRCRCQQSFPHLAGRPGSRQYRRQHRQDRKSVV